MKQTMTMVIRSKTRSNMGSKMVVVAETKTAATLLQATEAGMGHKAAFESKEQELKRHKHEVDRRVEAARLEEKTAQKC